jgi:hypothetical protein
MTRSISLTLVFLLGLPLVALAGGAEEISMSDFASFARGTLEGAALRSRGELSVGYRFERFELEDSFTAYSLARDERGRAFVGTGPNGFIYALEGDRLTRFGETGALLVSALAIGPDGTLYAGTLPEGRIFAFDAAGSARELVALEGAEHVWGLVYHPERKALIAATGPEGKLYSIDAAGSARVLLDAEQDHLLSLALDRDGAILVGTDGPALLYRVDARDQVRVAFELPGNELRAIAVSDEGIYAASNEMPAPPGSPAKPEAPAPLQAKLDRAKQGRGRLYRIGRDGSFERLLARTDGHFTSLSFDPEGNLLVAQAGEGRLFRIEARDRVGIAADLDDKQLLALDASRAPLLVVTGNGAALHRDGDRSEPPAYLSQVFDTGPGSRLGRLSFRGEGALRVQSRTGPRKEPDDSWTEWSAPIATPGPLRSPADRFVQLRVLFPERGDAVLRSLTLGYLPDNRRARVSNIRVEADEKSSDPTADVKLAWDVDEADGDELRYRLSFREESQSIVRPMFLEDVKLTKNRYTWDTSGIPDGHYVVTVEASDELVNPPSRTRTHREESQPIRVDNHPPAFTSIRVQGARVKGRVVDAMGPIRRLEVSVNGGPFRDRLPVDGILDGPEEDFDIDLGDLPQGEHIFTVRATDAAHNSARREVIVIVGR